jgi:hypothetical protein
MRFRAAQTNVQRPTWRTRAYWAHRADRGGHGAAAPDERLTANCAVARPCLRAHTGPSEDRRDRRLPIGGSESAERQQMVRLWCCETVRIAGAGAQPERLGAPRVTFAIHEEQTTARLPHPGVDVGHRRGIEGEGNRGRHERRRLVNSGITHADEVCGVE